MGGADGEAREVFDSANLRVVCWRSDAPLTLSVFGPRALDPTQKWHRHAREHGLGLIGVAPLRPSAYWPAELAEAARRLGPARPGERRVGVGWSVAGHAAIRHAVDFDLCATLTASATYALDPALVPGDPRQPYAVAGVPAELVRQSRLDGRAHRAGVRMWNIADVSDAAEAAHALPLARDCGVTTLPAFHVGHSTVNMLESQPVFGAVLRALLADDFGAARVCLRRARKERVAYPALLAAACLRHGHRGWARALLDRVDAMGWRADSREFDVIVAAHFRAGHLERALHLALHAIGRDVRRQTPYEIACKALRALRHDAEAEQVLGKGLALCPEAPMLRRLAERVAA